MNIKLQPFNPHQAKDEIPEKESPQEVVCEVCNGTVFHVVISRHHNFFVCANPICKEQIKLDIGEI